MGDRDAIEEFLLNRFSEYGRLLFFALLDFEAVSITQKKLTHRQKYPGKYRDVFLNEQAR